MADAQILGDVVTYADARALAQDAADSALDSHQVSVTEVAGAAADAAADAVASRIEDEQLNVLQSVAQQAADESLAGVQEKLDGQVEALREAQEVTTATPVSLASEQYDEIAYLLRVQTGALFLCMSMCAVCAGICLWLGLAGEFRCR